MTDTPDQDERGALSQSLLGAWNLYVFVAIMGLGIAGVVVSIVFQTIGHPAWAAAVYGVSALLFIVVISTRRKPRSVTGAGRR